MNIRILRISKLERPKLLMVSNRVKIFDSKIHRKLFRVMKRLLESNSPRHAAEIQLLNLTWAR